MGIMQDAEFASSQRSQKEYPFTPGPACAGSHSGKRLAASSAAKADGTYCSHDHLRGAVRALPSKECRLIEQLFWQERTETEVAAAMGINQSTINRRKHDILKGLRMKLRDRNEFQKFSA